MAIITPSHFVPGPPPLPDVKGGGFRPPPVSSAPGPAPILLADSITVQPSGEATFRAAAFTNNLGRRISIRQIRMTALLASEVGEASPHLALQMAVDDKPLTRGYVPIWNLARSYDRTLPLMSFYGQSDVAGLVSGGYVVNLASPIDLAPGQKITASVKHLGFGATAATMYLGFAGTQGGPAPSVRRLPYWASWSSRAFGFAEAASDDAPPGALLNDTGKDLRIVRIIGRTPTYEVTSGLNRVTSENDLYAQGARYMDVKLGLSQARPIIRDFTKVRAAFGPTGAIETDFMLKAGDYLTASAKHTAGVADGVAPALVGFQAAACLSFLGYREV